jgi:2-haloacid dehalogenase
LNPTATFKTVDEHHFDSLLELLTEDGLLAAGNAHGSLFDDGQLRELSLTWHYLDPWTDTPAGIRLFNEKFTTSTLSNGNLALMKDLVKFADMDFKHIMAADMFQAYKPNPKVYLGGAERLGLRPEECCMVAAHLDDLKHAKSNGLRTLFVDRAQEPIPESGVDYVDFWVSKEEDGFIAAASKLT